MSTQRLAVLFDAADEGWVSMEYVGQMLLECLQRDQRLSTSAHVKTLPRWARRFSQSRRAFNADRAGGRFLTYPLSVLKRRRSFDLFHVVDHSYAHLVHALPTRKTGVYCHDLDAFRSVMEPDALVKPPWFRAMARTQLLGLQRASVVFHSTEAVGATLRQWVHPRKLVHAPYGVSEEFTRDGPGVVEGPYLLHVGSSAARKRIDRVLEIFAKVARTRPGLRLVQQGAAFSDAQREQTRTLGIADRIIQQGFVDRKTLAALYRKAKAVFLPSDAEGFGLPVIEALT
ncbi:MAG: glycosyltransferase family 4 protein, partial [Myxococcaceae bacterium]